MSSFARKHRFEIMWAGFALVNLALLGVFARSVDGTVTFHVVWVSLALLYGYTVWRLGPTAVVMVLASILGLIVFEVTRSPMQPDELAEIPLLAAMFAAIAWHARQSAVSRRDVIRERERERDFMRDSSHHLKTPLALARGYAELIRRSSVTAEQSKDADVLLGELDRLTKIVDGMLLYVTTEHPESLDLRPVDVQDLIYGVGSRWMDAVDRRIIVHMGPNGSLLGDRERLEWALDALIENAVNATESDDPIWLLASCDEPTVTIRVADEGHGIRSEALDHIFERFWSESRHRDRRGTGLGLAIVKSIATAHGGTIGVSTEELVTVFTLQLPAIGVDQGNSSAVRSRNRPHDRRPLRTAS